FQAEDGIRDATVTGVQTCALPICACERKVGAAMNLQSETAIAIVTVTVVLLAIGSLLWLERRVEQRQSAGIARQIALTDAIHFRSEERRVGHEWRPRGGARCGKER